MSEQSSSARQWLERLLAPGFVLWDEDVVHVGQSEYERTRYAEAVARTGATEAVTSATGRLGGHEIACAVVDFAFLGGSLGAASGERLARALERGASLSGAVVVTASGGVRVQEGALALLQMARVVSARASLAFARRPLLTVATDPSFGGIAVSLVGTADVVLAEPGTRLGFVGPRAASAIGARARVDTAEEAQRGGLVDAILPREAIPGTLARLLDVLAPAA